MKKIDSLLDKVGLLKEKNKKVRTFSLGMKQRLMIACALVGNPDLLILRQKKQLRILRFLIRKRC